MQTKCVQTLGITHSSPLCNVLLSCAESESCAEETLDTILFLLQRREAADTKSFSAQLHCEKAFTTSEISLSSCWGCQITQSPKSKEDMPQILVWELSATTTVRAKQYLNSLSKSTVEQSLSLTRCKYLNQSLVVK